MRKSLYITGGICLLLFCFFDIYGQNTSYEWPNGRINDHTGLASILVSDSVLVVGHVAKEQNGNLYHTIRVFNTKTLNLYSKFNLKELSPQAYSHIALDNKGHLASSIIQNDTLSVDIFKLNFSNTSAVKIGSYQNASEGKLNSIGFAEGKLITIEVADNDTVNHIKRLNLNGNIEHHDSIIFIHAQRDSLFDPNFSLGPYTSPDHPNAFFMGNALETRVVKFDLATLKPILVTPKEQIDITFLSQNITHYTIKGDEITAGGSMIYCYYDSNWNIQCLWQTILNTRTMTGDSVSKIRYGGISNPEKGYAYSSDRGQHTEYLASSFPFGSSNLITDPVKRQIIVRRITKHGLDSIVLFGNKNHVAFELFAASGGDLIMLSTYTDSWTTDSTYYQLTLIPGFAIDLMEEKGIEKRVYLYPNPVDTKAFLEGIESEILKVELYDDAGRRVLIIDKPNKEIDLTMLQQGVYTLYVELKDGQPFTSQILKH